MRKKYELELKRIQASIPADLLKRLMKKEKTFSASKEIMERALVDPEVTLSPEQRRRYTNMLASGYFDKEEDVLDEEVEKQISDYVDAEIEKARKLGRLPKAQRPPKLINKGKKNLWKKKKQSPTSKKK